MSPSIRPGHDGSQPFQHRHGDGAHKVERLLQNPPDRGYGRFGAVEG